MPGSAAPALSCKISLEKAHCIEYTDVTEHDVDADVMAEGRRIMLEARVSLGQ
jgi:hypothetical protein